MTEELLDQYTPVIQSLTLLPSSGGRFEVKVNDRLIYSKQALGRHAQPGEVLRLFQEHTGLDPQPRE